MTGLEFRTLTIAYSEHGLTLCNLELLWMSSIQSFRARYRRCWYFFEPRSALQIEGTEHVHKDGQECLRGRSVDLP